MADRKVVVNRAPVLTLWGAVVTARLGYDWEEALTLGKAVAGLNAQAKGRSLGVFGPPTGPERSLGFPKKTGLGEEFWVEVLGRPVPAKRTEAGVRAVVKDQPLDPAAVQRYLERKFGEHLAPVQEALEALAASVPAEELEYLAYAWYEAFRPKIPTGKRGWGAAGELDLGVIRGLAERGIDP